MCDYKTSDPFQHICPVPRVNGLSYMNMTQQQLYNKMSGKKCTVTKNISINGNQNISKKSSVGHFLYTSPAAGKTTHFISQPELKEGRPGGNIKAPKNKY
jgi:hypothetical protein